MYSFCYVDDSYHLASSTSMEGKSEEDQWRFL
jgi:hypothetical protein